MIVIFPKYYPPNPMSKSCKGYKKCLGDVHKDVREQSAIPVHLNIFSAEKFIRNQVSNAKGQYTKSDRKGEKLV